MRIKVLVLVLALANTILEAESTAESQEKQPGETSHGYEIKKEKVTPAMISPQQRKTNKWPNIGKGKKPAPPVCPVTAEYNNWLQKTFMELLTKYHGNVPKFLNEFEDCGPVSAKNCKDPITSAILQSCRNSPNPLQCVEFTIPSFCLTCIPQICQNDPKACKIIPSRCCNPGKRKPTPGPECNRNCTKFTGQDQDFKECVWTFTAENQYSDQDGRKADGRNRKVLTYNGMIPGPSIVVCELDNVVIHLENRIDGTFEELQGQSNGTTMHFHGIRRFNASYEDGVPGVNQCEVESGGNFTYTLIGDDFHENAPPGTYWYHSHVGSQRTNGLYGALIIKPRGKSALYDVDNADNTLVLQEWYQTDRINIPISILINGNGRVGRKMNSVPNGTNWDVHVDKYNKGQQVSFDQVINPNFGNFNTNYSEFDVKYGFSYRFRIIGAISQNFPLCFKIEAHKFTAIATDSIDFKPVKNVNAVCLAAGERYDIVIKTKKKPKSKKPKKTAYKIKVFGHNSYSIPLCTVAWLKYPGQKVNYDYVTNSKCVGFNLDSSKKVLNPVMGTDFKNTSQHITINELKGKIKPKTIKNSVSNVNYIEIIDLTFNNMEMTYNDVPFLFQKPANKTNRCGPSCDVQIPVDFFIPVTLNFTCDDLPKKPDHCSDDKPCQCEHVIHEPHVPLFFGEFYWWETILINPYNEYMQVAHPIHQHGGWYHVLAVKQFDQNIKINRTIIEDLDTNCTTGANCLHRNFDWPIQKDTIQVPVNGYVIFRTPMDNAGTWIVHCHINHHVESGMAMIFQIGGLPDKVGLESIDNLASGILKDINGTLKNIDKVLENPLVKSAVDVLLFALHGEWVQKGSHPPEPPQNTAALINDIKDMDNDIDKLVENSIQAPVPAWSQDWSFGPYKNDVNKTCPRKIDTYQNPDAIDWFYGMKPIVACADPGNSITFTWLHGHNVNRVNEEVWKTCEGFGSNEIHPTNGTWTWPGNMTTGTYFFACGVGDGYHCKHGGLKAKVTVPCK